MNKRKSTIYAILVGFLPPWISYIVISPLFNHAEPLIFGMPPLMFWNLLWLFLTSVCLYGAYIIESRGGLIE